METLEFERKRMDNWIKDHETQRIFEDIIFILVRSGSQ